MRSISLNVKNGTLFQAARFSIVGILNTVIDFAVLNSLVLFLTTGNSTAKYGVFKMVSFVAALINSYFFNKYWVFPQKKKQTDPHEKFRFVVVSLVGFVLNITISTLFFSLLVRLYPNYLLSVANGGAILGTLVGADWKGKEFTGHDLGIPVVFNSRNHGYSSSELRNRIFKAEMEKYKSESEKVNISTSKESLRA